MFLADQVEILRRNLPEIKGAKCVYPMWGGSGATLKAYHFAFLVLPARDIMTTIRETDPGGSVLPARLRGWNIHGTDGYGNNISVHLKRILGMIVHLTYLHFNDKLDVINDLNERVIVPRDAFLDGVERLVLTREDICLVACALAEKSLNGIISKNRKIEHWNSEAPGSRDLHKILRDITSWPELMEIIWENHFKNQSRPINSGEVIIDGIPLNKGASFSYPTITWNVQWRRGTIYADARIDPYQLIATIQDFIKSQKQDGIK